MSFVAFKTQLHNPEKPELLPDQWPWGSVINLENSQTPPDESGEWVVMTVDQFNAHKAFYRPQAQAFFDAEDLLRIQQKAIEASITERRIWAEGLMERMKKVNLDNSISLSQSLWLHKRLRELDVLITSNHLLAVPALADQLAAIVDVPLKIDALNLIVSGDLETAFAVLLGSTPDDMTQPYHAFSQDLISWVMGELASYLGWS